MNNVLDGKGTFTYYLEEYNKNNPAQAPIKPAIRKSNSELLFVVYNETTGKVLKSVYYTPAKFNDIL